MGLAEIKRGAPSSAHGTLTADDIDRTPRYATIDGWCALTGMSRAAVYRGLGRGYLRGLKCGDRTLIDVPAGLAWMRSLPPAVIRVGRTAARPAA